jgi:hypothetical protein
LFDQSTGGGVRSTAALFLESLSFDAAYSASGSDFSSILSPVRAA